MAGGQIPPKRRYVTRVFGLYAGGTYRGQYVQRIPLYTERVATHVSVVVEANIGVTPVIYGYPPVIVQVPQAGLGTVTIQGQAPFVVKQAISAPGVGAVSVTGYAVTLGSTSQSDEVIITRRRVSRYITTGVYRRAQYRTTYEVLPLTTATAEEVGVGTITITGLQPTIDFSVGTGVKPGVGTVTIAGFAPADVVLQDLRYTGLWQTHVRRVEIGSGVYRRSMYRVSRRFLYFNTYQVAATTQVGSGTITVTGYQVSLEPNFRVVGSGAVSVQGYPPSPLLDDRVSTIGALELRVIRAQLIRRHQLAMWRPKYLWYADQRPVAEITQPRPSRIVGPSNATLRVIGYRPTIQRNISVSAGAITLTGYSVTLQIRSRTGVAAITVTGYPPTFDGDVEIQRPVGNGLVRIFGYGPIVNAAGVTNVSPGVGSVVIQGHQATPDVELSTTVAVGAGSVVIQGAAPGLSTVAQAGVGAVTIVGYAATANVELGVVNPGPGQIYIQNLRIGLSTPEKASNPGTGNVVYLGNAPEVVSTGAWEKTAGNEISWSHTSRYSTGWSKAEEVATGWTKK